MKVVLIHRLDMDDPGSEIAYTDTFKLETDEQKAEMGAELPTEQTFVLEIEHSKGDCSAFTMAKVESTNISHIGYDPVMKEMMVGFRRTDPPKGPGGLSLYLYQKVEAAVFLRIIQAKSVGKRFQQIKKDLVDFEKIAG